MLRDPALVPLSHQHQHALALCVRIGKAFEKAGETPDVHPWEAEIVRVFDEEISFHFTAEERYLFPIADRFEGLMQLIDELRIEHTLLRRNVEKARNRQFTVTDLQVFTASLSEHIRKEERQLFEGLQRLLSADQMANVAESLTNYFASSGMPGQSCGMHGMNDNS